MIDSFGIEEWHWFTVWIITSDPRYIPLIHNDCSVSFILSKFYAHGMLDLDVKQTKSGFLWRCWIMNRTYYKESIHISISKLRGQVQSNPKLPKQHHKTNPIFWVRCDCWFLQICLQWWEEWGHTLQSYDRSPSICGPRVLRLAANTRLTTDLMWEKGIACKNNTTKQYSYIPELWRMQILWFQESHVCSFCAAWLHSWETYQYPIPTCLEEIPIIST